MATETDETPNPENETSSETAETAKKAEKTPAAGARRPRRPRAKATTARTKAKAEEAPTEPAAEKVETDIVVRGESIRNDGAETILSNVDVGPAEPDAWENAMGSPVVITTVETFTVEDGSPYDDAPDLGAADMIVDMLNGLAEADAPQDLSDTVDIVEVETEAPYWYVMSRQVEDAQRTAAANRKAGRLAKKLERQVLKAARVLQDVFELAATDASVMECHQRSIARLIALLEVAPPRDKDDQRVFADIIRTERRSLAEIIRSLR